MSGAKSQPEDPASKRGPYAVVLAVVDGSPWAAAAVGLAARLAERAGGALHVAGAVLPGGAKVALGPAAEVTQPGSHEFTEQLDEHVRDVAQKARDRWRCPVHATMIASPEPEAGADSDGWGLPEYERREHVDLTVVGIRPHPDRDGRRSPGGEPPRLRSDIAEALSSPLLLVPSSDDDIGEAAAEPIDLGVIAVAVAPDAPAGSREVVRHAARLAEVAGSELRVIGPRPAGVDDVEAIEAPGGDDELMRLLREGIAGTVALASDRLHLAERILFDPGAEASRPIGVSGGSVNVLLCPGG